MTREVWLVCSFLAGLTHMMGKGHYKNNQLSDKCRFVSFVWIRDGTFFMSSWTHDGQQWFRAFLTFWADNGCHIATLSLNTTDAMNVTVFTLASGLTWNFLLSTVIWLLFFVFLWPLVIEVSDQTGEKPAGECVQFKLGAHCQLVKLINECTHSFMTAESTLAHLVVTHVMYCVWNCSEPLLP